MIEVNHAVAVVILSFSGVAVGGAIALLFAPRDTGLAGRDRLDRLALDASRLGFAIMVALISEAIARADSVDAERWRTWVYLIGSVLAGIGYVTLVIRGYVRHRRENHRT